VVRCNWTVIGAGPGQYMVYTELASYRFKDFWR